MTTPTTAAASIKNTTLVLRAMLREHVPVKSASELVKILDRIDFARLELAQTQHPSGNAKVGTAAFRAKRADEYAALVAQLGRMIEYEQQCNRPGD